MAHIVVYLQRTPIGLHPGSLMALCVARDIADVAGASVTALCEGDAKSFDDALITQASACGTDELFFVGPNGLPAICQRLQPLHVFAPATEAGERAAGRAGFGPPTAMWIDSPTDDHGKFPRVTTFVAGTLPWQAAPMSIEPEYEGDVGEVALPEWLADAPSPLQARAPSTYVYVAPQNLDATTEAALRSLGASSVAPDHAAQHREGVLLWLDAGPNGLPDTLGQRPPQAQVVLLAGPHGRLHQSWKLADWVIGGEWPDAVRELQGSPWRAALG